MGCSEYVWACLEWGQKASKTIATMCVCFSLPGELSITGIQLFLLCSHWTECNQEVLEPI